MTRTLETNKYMKKILILGAIIAAASTASAKVTLPRIFSNGMVMQQQTEANLWGTAKGKRHGEDHGIVEQKDNNDKDGQ